MTIYVCSNPNCRASHNEDPRGHCPVCKREDGSGWSTVAIAGRDTTEAAKRLMAADDAWLGEVARHDPDMIRDVAAALTHARSSVSTEAQIKHMVDRFLDWRLPENFHPDDGISFKPTFNDHLPTPTRHEPTGTNLFDASQADAMVRYMIDGLPQP